MFCHTSIDIAGWIVEEPTFLVTKQGTPYCKFKVATSNNTGGDNEIMRFSCFCWAGQQFNILKQANLTMKDEVFVSGMFSYKSQNGYEKPFVHLQIYVNYIKIIRSSAAEKAMNQLNSSRIIEEVPLNNKQHNKVSNTELRIDANDNPWG